MKRSKQVNLKVKRKAYKGKAPKSTYADKRLKPFDKINDGIRIPHNPNA